MASDAVLKFLTDHNRPFSANDIQQGIPGDFGKAAVLKALDSLTNKEKVREKVYGKQKVYFLSQKLNVPMNEFKENLMEVDRQILDYSLQVKEINDKLSSCNAQLVGREKAMSLEEAEEKLNDLKKEYVDIQSKVQEFDGVEVGCPKEKARVEAQYNKTLSEYRKRKRLCMDVLNSILENYPKTKKHLFEEIGIETDEDAGFSLDKL